MTLDTIISPLNPDTFEYQTYSNSDEQLIVQSPLDTIFSTSTDYIEYYVYDQNKKLIYPAVTTPLVDYNVREGDVLLDPSSNLEELGFDVGVYNILYSFYRKRGSSSITNKYFISEISSDRTEIRLDSNTIENEDIISSINDFVDYREQQTYFVDFYLNFGQNKTCIANNIKLETEEGIDPTVLIKLYEPLPANFGLKNELWLVELLSQPQAYEVDFPFEPIIEDDFTYIAGPNYSLNITGQTATPGEVFSYNTLLNSDVTSSINQIQSLLNEKEININIDYEKYSNFINFSSANTRLENFFYKVELIQSKTLELISLSTSVTSNTTNTFAFSSSEANLTSQIDTIIKNFDGYEYFLYFNSGSTTSYPKSNTQPPFNLLPTSNTEVQSWITSSAASSSAYDEENKDWLYYSIPEYLREDSANRNYELFVDMVGQYYDNVWLYTKDVTNKFDADNRLDYGISKDLVADAIKDFAVKLYSNNFNTDDLFTAFLGITPSGSAFPFPYMTGSIGGAVATPSGFEYVDTQISASNDIVPLDDVNKSIYKRIYHNIPYLLKTKGTVAGLRALITSYGIPDTILRISEFGGKDRNESQDYDLKQDVFNYAFDTGTDADNYISSSMPPNSKFPNLNTPAEQVGTVQFRFKPSAIPLPINNVANSNIRYSQSLWLTDRNSGAPTWLDADLGAAVVLEYNGKGLISGSYSGSVPDARDINATLKFYPDIEYSPTEVCAVEAPFFNDDWWSLQLTFTGDGTAGSSTVTASMFVANEIGGEIGYSLSSSKVNLDGRPWNRSNHFKINDKSNHIINSTTYTPFSGSFQEYRMYVPMISQSNFFDYTVNPYSDEGNGINSTPNQLFFRAALGTQLDTGSRTSIHPRITGSAIQITQSFATNSEFYIESSRFVTNVEDIFQDQVPAGIKNRITNKIQTEKLILAEAPYGFPNPTSSVPEISSAGNDTQTISAMESMQQYSYVSQSYTPNVNYLEVAFSPSNQINDDINAQLGYFNLGEFIGDPRFVSSSLYTYPDLDRLRDSYFEKYMSSYDIVDFIRLIKFFDNSLFKMIKDFTPARSSLASGVVVKQHLLERNRQRPAQVTSSQHVYEGLVVNLPKDYSSGSSDFPQYSTEGSSLYKFSGGPGGSFNRFNGLQTYPDVLGTYGSLQGNTSLIPVIISNDIVFTTNGVFDDTLIDVPNKGNGLYPINVDLSLDIEVSGLKVVEIDISTTEASQKWSEGNIITIPGSEFSQGTGNIVIQLTRAQIQYAGPVTVPFNRFGITQSWQDGNDGSVLNTTNFNQSSSQYISGSYLGPRTFPKDNQSEFYNGIFSGSKILITNGDLNPGCEPYLNANDTPIVYRPLFFSLSTGLDQVVQQGEFLDQNNVPPSGKAWIASTQTNLGGAGQQQVYAIKLSETDVNGTEVINYLDDFTSLRLLLPDANLPFNEGAVEYIITGRTIYPDHALLFVSQEAGIQGNNYYRSIPQLGAANLIFPAITSSANGGSENWSLSASTNYNTFEGSPNIPTTADDLFQQGAFLNPGITNQEQSYYFWNGSVEDPLNLFNKGIVSRQTSTILNTTESAYTIPYTPNIPWMVSASILVSSSYNPNAEVETVDDGIYHSASLYQGAGLTNQNSVLGASVSNGFFYISAPASSPSAANQLATPTSAGTKVYVNGAGPIQASLAPITNFYSNPDLTVRYPTNFINQYYKIANGNSAGGSLQYVVVRIILNINTGLSQLSSVESYRNPPIPGKDSLRPTSYSATNNFRPATKFTQDLGTVNFNPNTNTQIPGSDNPGPANVTIAGGHPKIKQAGTASLRLELEDLTLAGTVPTLNVGSSTFVFFSGSTADSTSPANGDFTIQGGGGWGGGAFANPLPLEYTGGSVPNMGAAYDGSVQISPAGIISYIDANQGELVDTTNGLRSIRFRVNADIISDITSTDTFQVQFIAQTWNESPSTLGLEQILKTLTSQLVNGVQRVVFSNSESSPVNMPNLLPNGTDADDYIRLVFKVKSPSNGSAFKYEFRVEEIAAYVEYINENGTFFYPGQNQYDELYNGGGSPSERYQIGNVNNSPPVVSTDFYPEAVVDIFLKRTGSFGGTDYDLIITSSVFDASSNPTGGYSGSIHSGSIISFNDPDFPTLPDLIFNNIAYDGTDATSGSTRNEIGDIYYIEYSFRDYKPGVIGGVAFTTQNLDFETNSDQSRLQITQSVLNSGGGGVWPTAFDATGSLKLRKYSLSNDNTGLGQEVISIPFQPINSVITPTPNPIRINIEAPITNQFFQHDDIYRFSIGLDKVSLGSGMVIQELTASIFPNQSIWSPITAPFEINNFRTPLLTDFLVPTFYGDSTLPFDLALDCQPLLNNFNLQRKNTWLMNVSYTNLSGPIIPVNQKQILDGTAVRASVPDSNYTSLVSINPKYNGVKSTSAKLNIWSVGDIGTFGKNPTVELRDAYFGYFNDISDPYPNINALTRVNINYLIDEQGNALPPSLNDQLSIDTFKQVFPNTTLGKLAIKDGKNRYTPLSTPTPISRIMEYVTPICYSQNSGNNYSKSIPLSGSGYISRYDNNDENDIDFAQFSVAGTSSVVDIVGTDRQTVSYYLDAAETNASPVGATTPYSVTTLTGSASYPTSTWGTAVPDTTGQALNNQQIVSVQHSIVTTYVSETRRVGQELKMTFRMFTGSDAGTESPFNLEGIDCKVYTETGQVYLLRDVDNYGWFRYENLPTTQLIRDRVTDYFLTGFNKWEYTRVPIPGGGIVCTADWEMYDTLFDLGLMRERSPRNGSGVVALEWIFKANSGNVDIKQGEKISWKMEGEFRNARGGFQQGYFFPNAYTGAYTPAMIKGMGALDYKLDEANKAVAPFWTFSGSATALDADLSIIEMSSSNFNEAYGTGFYQGDLPYEPGFSEYFPGSIEPKTTTFDKIENPIEFLEGDEIRFGNNESFTYKVLEVFAPSENVSSSAAGSFAKVKLKLNKPVDASINKDFFLIRRPITTPQSLYLDTPFPYGILSSGSIFTKIKQTGSIEFGLTSSTATGNFPSPDGAGLYTASISDVEALSTPGILYPDFPTEYLVQSASMIVNDLISKGIIES